MGYLGHSTFQLSTRISHIIFVPKNFLNSLSLVFLRKTTKQMLFLEVFWQVTMGANRLVACTQPQVLLTGKVESVFR